MVLAETVSWSEAFVLTALFICVFGFLAFVFWLASRHMSDD